VVEISQPPRVRLRQVELLGGERRPSSPVPTPLYLSILVDGVAAGGFGRRDAVGQVGVTEKGG
jgi:hypothetical protein